MFVTLFLVPIILPLNLLTGLQEDCGRIFDCDGIVRIAMSTFPSHSCPSALFLLPRIAGARAWTFQL